MCTTLRSGPIDPERAVALLPLPPETLAAEAGRAAPKSPPGIDSET